MIKYRDKNGDVREIEGDLFVTRDKNGRDVFGDDPVWFHWMGKKTKAKVVKDDLFTHLVSCEGKVQGLPRTFCKSDRFHIELIEDKQDD